MLLAGLLVVGVGCKTHRTVEWDNKPAATGSISELADREKATQAKSKPALTPILFLVSHDAAGKVTAVGLRQSSGDPAVDARAQEWMLKRQKFPVGQADTVVIEINPRKVPRR